VVSQTKNFLSSDILFESRFSIPETSPSASMKRLETIPVQVSQSNIQSDLNVSPALSPSHPFNVNLEGCSPRWSSSHERRLSIFAGKSQAIETTDGFFSNPLLATLSDLASILFPTAMFLTLGNNQLKVSMESARITSVAVSGALVALITIVCLCLILHRRYFRPQAQEQMIEDHSEEDEFDDEEENFFRLEDTDRTNWDALSESESGNWVGCRIRGENDMRMDFDGEESLP
jgi:membrane protein implicated in regulation of membrane protease activity